MLFKVPVSQQRTMLQQNRFVSNTTEALDIRQHPEFIPFISMFPRPGALEVVAQNQL